MSSHLSSGVIAAILLSAASTSSTVEAATTHYTCPPVDTSKVISEATQLGLSTTVNIARTTAKSELCTVVRRKISTGGRRAPVARSYAGRDWEKSAGFFARSGSGLTVDCQDVAVAGTCDLTLPSLGADQEYVLESFSYEVSAEVEAARFLEQVSVIYS